MNLVRGNACRAAAALVWLCILSATVRADGRVFWGRPEPLSIPDQEAILCFRGGVETLAIRTRAVTQTDPKQASTPIAWVVPVPGPETPTLGTTSDGTFVAADRMLSTRYRDRTDSGEGSCVLVFGLVAAFGVLGLRMTTPDKLRRAVRTALLTLYGVLLLSIALCAGLPTLAKSRSSAPVPIADGVESLAAARVGTLEVTVLRASPQATSASALREWLSKQGCVLPAEADPVIQEYAREGWVFVASRLSDHAAAGRLQPTPLVMTFKTPSPIYPMRLTGVGNGPIDLSLFVLAAGAAAAPGMTVDHSVNLFSLNEFGVYSGDSSLGMKHAGFTSLFGTAADSDGAAWGTRLYGTLSAAGQRRDLHLTIGDKTPSRRELYTPRAASSLGVTIGLTACGALLLLVSGWALVGRRPAGWIVRATIVTLAVSVILGIGVAKSVPTAMGDFHYVKPASRRDQQLADLLRGATLTTEHDARAWIATQRAAKAEYWTDLSDESDGPDGWALRTDERGVLWFETYDSNAERLDRDQIFPVPPPKPSR